MRLFKTYWLVFIFFFTMCKKDKVDGAAPSRPPCKIGLTGTGKIIDGSYIVTVKSGARLTPEHGMRKFAEKILLKNKIAIASLYESFQGELPGFIASLSEPEAALLKKDPNIRSIEANRIVALGGCFKVVDTSLITWNVKRVGYGDGVGKTVWISDSGVEYSHPDLTIDSIRSRCFLPGELSANDEYGHGTHVAGIIAAKNNNEGILGVASGATIVSLRVLDKYGIGTSANIVRALAYVSDNAKPGDVVNMSTGAGGISNTLDQQVAATAAKGIFVVMAAGNDAQMANQFSPGRVNSKNIYTVSAIDSLDQFAVFSNYGNDVVDYAAPGVNILSTWTGNRYALSSGTSMAAPHVSGLLLLKGKNINISGYAGNDPDRQPDPVAHY